MNINLIISLVLGYNISVIFIHIIYYILYKLEWVEDNGDYKNAVRNCLWMDIITTFLFVIDFIIIFFIISSYVYYFIN